VRWKAPTLAALGAVVLLAAAGALAGLTIRGAAGAVIGAIAGGLAGVAAGYVPVFHSRADEQQSRLEHAVAQLTEASEPRFEQWASGPSLLLRPERAIVKFTGRETELATLQAWCESSTPKSVQVMTGSGGVGKTRLALHVATWWKEAGGLVVHVASGAEATVLKRTREVTAGPVLLVADYAETRLRLRDLLRAVLDDAGRVRVLLLARSLGEWWDRLAEESSPAVGQFLSTAGMMPLDAPLADVPDADLATAAVPAFAAELGVATPECVIFDLPDSRMPVLVLHAAALIAVLRSEIGSQTNSPGPMRVAVTESVLGELLEHEARYWRRAAAAHGLQDDGRVLKTVVAAAVLLGAGSLEEAAAVASRVPDLAGEGGGVLRRWGRWLFELYPGEGGRLGSVQPDLLAEYHAVIQLAGDLGLAHAVLSAIDGRQAVQALTILGRAWKLHDEAGQVIGNALHADLAGLAVAAAEVAIQTEPQVGMLLADGLANAPATLHDLVRIAETMPYPSVAVAGAQLAVTLRIRSELPPHISSQTTARWADRCGVLLSQAGRPAEAIPHTQEAVALYRELAAATPDQYHPDLAQTLSNLGVRFSELGRPAEALPRTQEAVVIYRELAAATPDKYRPDLARSLSNLGVWLRELRRPVEALPVTEESVTIYRELAALQPGRYRPDLAGALSNLGVRYSAMGRLAEALQVTEDAVAIRRELASAMPDQYSPDLPGALSNLGVRYSQVGRLADALPVTLEAVALYRELADAMPDRYRPDLAAALSNLGVRYSELGYPAEALPPAEEAVAIYRELAAMTAGRYRPGLARSLYNLAIWLQELGRLADALPVTEEVVTIRRELTTAMPDRYRPDLAAALSNLGMQYSELGRSAEALPPAEEAVNIYRELATAMPDRYRPRLTQSLYALSIIATTQRRQVGEAAETGH
jgi:tetratricopeptide (TPR) repeat protein